EQYPVQLVHDHILLLSVIRNETHFTEAFHPVLRQFNDQPLALIKCAVRQFEREYQWIEHSIDPSFHDPSRLMSESTYALASSGDNCLKRSEANGSSSLLVHSLSRLTFQLHLLPSEYSTPLKSRTLYSECAP